MSHSFPEEVRSLLLLFASVGLGGCGDRVECNAPTQETLDVQVPTDCSAGHCAAWADAPCEDVCRAFVSENAYDFVSCAASELDAGTERRVVKCTLQVQQCDVDYWLPSGRPQRGHRALGPRAGRDAVGRFFAWCAEAEHSSVFAFLELADAIREHGLPAALAARCVEAAADEARHRVIMTALARARGVVPARAVASASDFAGLESLALDNACGGRVAETWAAALTLYGARHATSPQIRAALAPVAHDEARHAGLARDLASALERRLSRAANARVEHARAAAIVQARAELASRSVPLPLRRAGLLPAADECLALFDALFALEEELARCAA